MKNSINIDEVISRSIKNAIREYDKEKRMEQQDKRLHNTRLLMENYNKLNAHIDSVSDKIVDLNIDTENIEDLADKAWIISIMRTKLRTMKMMAYVDSALAIIKEDMVNNCIEYKYRAFELYFIKKKTNEEIIGILGCGKNQPKIWSDLVLDKLSILLWGIEALGI